jgi:hypothetical protein
MTRTVTSINNMTAAVNSTRATVDAFSGGKRKGDETLQNVSKGFETAAAGVGMINPIAGACVACLGAIIGAIGSIGSIGATIGAIGSS